MTRRPGAHVPPPPAATDRTAVLCACLFLVLTWGWFGLRWPDLLHQFQDRSLFLTTGAFFIDALRQPAGLLSYAGCIFTACCAIPWLGAGLLAGCLAASGWLLSQLCRADSARCWMAFVPAAASVWLLPEAGYAIFQHLDTSWAFNLPLGLLGMTGLAALLRRCGRPWSAVLWTAAGYLTCGLFASGAVLLYSACLLKERARRKVPALLSAAATTALLPLVAYRFVWMDALAVCYTAPLPSPSLHRMLWFKSLLPAVLACTVPLWPVQKTSNRRHTAFWKPSAWTALLCALTWTASCHDASFRMELKALHLLENQKFTELRDLTKHLSHPTATLLDMKAMAADYTLHLGDDFFDGFGPAATPSARLGWNGQSACKEEFSFYSGLVNDCHHWAMEDMAFHRPTLHTIRLLAMSALLNGETELVHKYAGILQHTLYQRKLGRQLTAWADHPDQTAAHPVFSRITAAMPHHNQLTNNAFNPVSYYLQLEEGHEAELLRSLTAALFTNNSELFLTRLPWLTTPDNPPAPKHFQEAVAIFDLTTAPGCADYFSIPAAVRQRAAGFLNAWRAAPERAPQLLRDQYGDTYYYYLFSMDL